MYYEQTLRLSFLNYRFYPIGWTRVELASITCWLGKYETEGPPEGKTAGEKTEKDETILGSIKFQEEILPNVLSYICENPLSQPNKKEKRTKCPNF